MYMYTVVLALGLHCLALFHVEQLHWLGCLGCPAVVQHHLSSLLTDQSVTYNDALQQ